MNRRIEKGRTLTNIRASKRRRWSEEATLQPKRKERRLLNAEERIELWKVGIEEKQKGKLGKEKKWT